MADTVSLIAGYTIPGISTIQGVQQLATLVLPEARSPETAVARSGDQLVPPPATPNPPMGKGIGSTIV